MTETVRLAVDVGGTFTDVVSLDESTGRLEFAKVSTVPSDPSAGVLDAFAASGVAVSDVDTFIHGTTLGLNALLTRTGARVAVVATHGFRDVYLLGRTDRPMNYAIAYRKPPALLERADTFEVVERLRFDGSVETEFSIESAREVARVIAERGYDAVAVGFLHAYANPGHEQRMREVLLEEAPGIMVSLSHELSREYREYERTSTAVLDAYTKPLVGRYLDVLSGALDRQGFTGKFLMTHSGGGAMTAAAAKEQPVNLILSGPAGGVIGASAFSRLIEEPNLITIDMGGTSLDASLIVGHEPVVLVGGEFEQMPINMPSLDIHTIGAGGGSVAYLDAAGALQVGPRSAGAAPGPASYNRGGEEPTFTDAALCVGFLGTDAPLGGTLALRDDLARKALTPIATSLAMTVEDLAAGILRISTAKIVGAVRTITVEAGRDPKDFALLSFGGGGGLVSADVARELGVRTVLVPPGQGAFSALGMLLSDVQHSFARTLLIPSSAMGGAESEARFGEMEHDARRVLVAEGFAADRQVLARSVDARYVGQEHTVTVASPTEGADGGWLESAFTREYQQKYGHTQSGPIEITTVRVRATGLVPKPDLPRAEARPASRRPAPVGRRKVYRAGRFVEYSRYAREDLRAGDALAGPAIIHEHTATTVVHEGDTVSVGAYGQLTVSIAATTDHKEER
ncbi:hydantoinase/oxoprolinase family protein [Embleya sp. NBC_00888]|uniref:hydantoinase/oxoprolinase family protein n=1 Tax=Embleya sp. NBC_00888 TaxID=2975960 RepID=UPI003867CDDC|nr:hydantoinase/oxoprolinase family protein [Embleya sp. NBC_00888]